MATPPIPRRYLTQDDDVPYYGCMPHSTAPPDLELGQIAFGNPWGDHACPQWCDALVREILREIERVFWNKRQREWDMCEDPGVPGVDFRPYYWGDDEAQAALPNLKYQDIEVRWYKYPLRSTSLNVEARPDVLIPWFESAIAAIQASERYTP